MAEIAARSLGYHTTSTETTSFDLRERDCSDLCAGDSAREWYQLSSKGVAAEGDAKHTLNSNVVWKVGWAGLGSKAWAHQNI